MTVEALRLLAGSRMSEVGAHIRPVDALDEAVTQAEAWVRAFRQRVCCDSPFELPDAFRLRDILITRYVFLASIREYATRGGGSRGSSLLAEATDGLSNLPGGLTVKPENALLRGQICETALEWEGETPQCRFRWVPVRPVPERDDWFENVWRDYREGFPE